MVCVKDSQQVPIRMPQRIIEVSTCKRQSGEIRTHNNLRWPALLDWTTHTGATYNKKSHDTGNACCRHESHCHLTSLMDNQSVRTWKAANEVEGRLYLEAADKVEVCLYMEAADKEEGCLYIEAHHPKYT